MVGVLVIVRRGAADFDCGGIMGRKMPYAIWVLGLVLGLVACGVADNLAEVEEIAASGLRTEGRILRNAEPVRGQYIVILKPEATATQDIQDVATNAEIS
jgi:hypothetical protein